LPNVRRLIGILHVSSKIFLDSYVR